MRKTYIVAEIGPNHNGSLDRAVKMVERIAKTGADAVKFQMAIPDELYSLDAFKAEYQRRDNDSETVKEMSARNQLTREEHVTLYNLCRERGIAYLCTAFDLESLMFLDSTFDLPYFKVASGEIFSLDMLDYMAQRDKPLILSTGMAMLSEVEEVITILNRNFRKQLTLLHCVSNYPAPYDRVNLLAMLALREAFGYPVGFSDHTAGNACAIAAVSLGASLIEKHVTADRSLPGPDHSSSSTIEEFAELVTAVRTVETALGSSRKEILPEEREIARMARKSIVSRRNLAPGTRITERDICFKRPGTGLIPLQKDLIIGRRVKTAIEKDRVITKDMLEWQ